MITSFSRVGISLRKRLDDWPPLDGYDLTGRVVVLTGGTSGIGKAAAATLARCGATLVVVGRSEERNQEVVVELRQVTGNDQVTQVAADMGDYEQVRSLAAQLLGEHRSIDTLIHNAGALSAERHDAPDGIEATVASQVVGPFLLTGLLLDRLATSAPARVLTMSSGGMYTAELTIDQLQMPADAYKGATQYARAKRAQVTLNELWAQRFGHLGIHFHAMHPGWVDTPGVDASLPTFAKVMGPLLRTPDQGADTLVWLAADDEALASNGKFWLDRHQRSTHKLRSTRTADTDQRRERLWKWVKDACGLDPAATTGGK